MLEQIMFKRLIFLYESRINMGKAGNFSRRLVFRAFRALFHFYHNDSIRGFNLKILAKSERGNLELIIIIIIFIFVCVSSYLRFRKLSSFVFLF